MEGLKINRGQKSQLKGLYEANESYRGIDKHYLYGLVI